MDVTSPPCPHLQSAYPPAAWPPGRPTRCPLDAFTPPHLVPRKHLGPHSLRTELRSVPDLSWPGLHTSASSPSTSHSRPNPRGQPHPLHSAVQNHWQTLGTLPPDHPPHNPPTKSLCLPPKPADSPADPSVTSKMQLGSQASSTTPSAVSPTLGLSGFPEHAQGRFLCLEAVPRLFPLPGGAAPLSLPRETPLAPALMLTPLGSVLVTTPSRTLYVSACWPMGPSLTVGSAWSNAHTREGRRHS